MTSFTKLTFVGKREQGESRFVFCIIPVNCNAATSAALTVWAQMICGVI